MQWWLIFNENIVIIKVCIITTKEVVIKVQLIVVTKVCIT